MSISFTSSCWAHASSLGHPEAHDCLGPPGQSVPPPLGLSHGFYSPSSSQLPTPQRCPLAQTTPALGMGRAPVPHCFTSGWAPGQLLSGPLSRRPSSSCVPLGWEPRRVGCRQSAPGGSRRGRPGMHSPHTSKWSWGLGQPLSFLGPHLAPRTSSHRATFLSFLPQRLPLLHLLPLTSSASPCCSHRFGWPWSKV